LIEAILELSMELALSTSRVKAGEWFPPVHTKTIHGRSLSVPNAAAPFLHLQFLRFAGSSVCNHHLRSFVRCDLEIRNAGITEVVIFHSSKEELLPYHGYSPFAVVADPEKRLYQQYGVGSSVAALFDPRAWPAIVQASFLQDKPAKKPEPNGGIWALPAEFLIAESGMVKAAHYGKHVGDRWSVDELLSLARSQPQPGKAGAQRTDRMCQREVTK
jgi:peroxiredoxin